MLRLLPVIAVLILNGCDFFRGKKSPDTAPTSVPSEVTAAEAPPEALLRTDEKAEALPNSDCESLEHANAAALTTWTMANGVQFVICEFGLEAERLSENSFSGWVNVARREDDRLTALIAEVNSEKPNDAYSFLIRKVSDTEIQISRQIRPLREDIGDDYFSVMERKITCTKPGACVVGAEKCGDFKKDALVDKEAVATVRDVVAGKQKLEELGAYDMIIAKLVQAAIAGDPLAKKLMLNTPEKKLKIDGAAAGSYFDGKHLLTAMQKLRCLK